MKMHILGIIVITLTLLSIAILKDYTPKKPLECSVPVESEIHKDLKDKLKNLNNELIRINGDLLACNSELNKTKEKKWKRCNKDYTN